MTDNEVIKALECCKKRYNAFLCTNDCPVYNKCISVVPPEELIEGALNLINSQKAEIEKWRNAFMGECMLSACSAKKELQSEAIKEFAETVRRYIKSYCNPYGKPTLDYDTSVKIMHFIDNLVKEMTEENEK